MKQVYNDLLPELYRTMKPGAHLYMFFANEWYGYLVNTLKLYGFHVSPCPIIWDKLRTTTPNTSQYYSVARSHAVKDNSIKRRVIYSSIRQSIRRLRFTSSIRIPLSSISWSCSQVILGRLCVTRLQAQGKLLNLLNGSGEKWLDSSSQLTTTIEQLTT
jgi:hypothetical protein